MKSSGRKKRKALEISQENQQQTVSEEKRSTKGNCRRSPKPPGGENCLMLEKDQNMNPSGTCKSSSWCKSLSETARVKDSNLQTGEILSSAKLKLQFFPLDETTRLRLEKDGHNPFLELTLSTRKKISSVIKHLNNKWGSSSAAIGELMLFPYDMRSEKFPASRRWTSDNGGITAGELYQVLESPPVFRLRYGWFSELHSESAGIFSACGKACNSFTSISSCLTEQLKVDNQEIRNSLDVHNTADIELSGQTSVALLSDQLISRANEVMAHSAPAQPVVLWDDSLTSLSVGGLFSEASMWNKINNSAFRSDIKSGLQPILISDISIGGLLQEAEVSSQNKSVNPDLMTENGAGLNPISLDSEVSVGILLSEASLLGKVDVHGTILDRRTLGLQPLSETRAPQSPWNDGLTTLSIGGLQSDASLQAKIANSDLKSEGGTTNSQFRIPNFDSFDAFLAAQSDAQPQAPNAFLLDFHADDTCHAFPFQNLSSCSKDSKAPKERDNSRGYFDNSRSKTLRLPRRHKCFADDSLQQTTRKGL